MFFRRFAKRKGAIVVLVALMLISLIAISGLAIDVGMAYRMKAQMQSACDAAALAAVTRLPDTTAAAADALTYTALNGFTNGSNCTVTSQLSPAGQGPNTYRVTMTASYTTLFVQMVGAKTIGMSCYATAKYFSLSPISIYGGGKPGNENQTITAISLYGPYANHDRGDFLSPKYLNSGAPNPTYQPNGIDFNFHIPANYTATSGAGAGQNLLKVEIFDPNSDVEASDPLMNQVKPINPNIASPPAAELLNGGSNIQTTKFSLFPPSANPNDHSHDVAINSFTESSNPAHSQTWVNPAGWTIDVSGNLGKDYRINCQSIASGSKNSFLLRAAPPGFDYTKVATTVDPTMGAYKSSLANAGGALDIAAAGTLPIAFQGQLGTAHINMGTLPPAAGTPYSVFVTDFDLDVGAPTLTITDSSGVINTGTVGGQGQDTTVTTVINVPGTYPGGVLTSNYSATIGGSDDNSCWQMYFTGAAPGQPGQVQLVE